MDTEVEMNLSELASVSENGDEWIEALGKNDTERITAIVSLLRHANHISGYGLSEEDEKDCTDALYKLIKRNL